MKQKNVNFFELHVEKVAMGIAVLFALLVVWLYCLGSPYDVTDQSRNPVAPDEVDKKLLDLARDLEQRIKLKESPFEQIEVPDYTQEFAQTREQDLVPVARYPLPLGPQGLDPKHITVPEIVDQRPYELAKVPAPEDIRVRADYAVLASPQDMEALFTEQDRALMPQEEAQASARAAASSIGELVGEREPRDMRYVSVVGEFDLGEYFQRYQELAETERVPEQWQRTSMLVTDVAIERQTFDPQTGEWGDTRLIDVLPRSISFRKTQPEDVMTAIETKEEAEQLLAYIASKQRDIAQQPFVPLTGARGWVSPDSRLDVLSDDDRGRWLDLTEKIKKLEETIRKTGGTVPGEHGGRTIPDPINDPGALPPGFDPLGQFGRPEIRGQAVPDAPRIRRDAPAEREAQPRPARPAPRGGDRRTRLLEESEKRKADRIKVLIDDLNVHRAERSRLEGLTEPEAGPGDLHSAGSLPGVVPRGGVAGPEGFGADRLGTGRDRVGGAAGDVRDPGRGAPVPGSRGTDASSTVYNPLGRSGGRDALGQPDEGGEAAEPVAGSVRLLAHDVTVQPDMTYRYRMRVMIVNPLFQQEQLHRDQKQLKNVLALESPWSEWSEPVTTEPDQRFFLVGGDQGRAVVEIWRLFNGRWRQKDVQVMPGDSVSASVPVDDEDFRGELQMVADALVVDVDTDAPPTPGMGNTRTVRMWYLQTSTEGLLTRSADVDRVDPTREKLRFEYQQTRGVARLE